MNKKVLIITYYWPPSGGSGVQRWLKFVKYLPAAGVKPFVFTPANPSFNLRDESLHKDVSSEATVVHYPIWEPYELFFRLSGIFGKKKSARPTDVIAVKNKSLFQRFSTWVRGNLIIPDPRKFWVKPSVKFLERYLAENGINTIITTGPPHSMHLIGYQLKKRNPTLRWMADFRDPWSEWGFLDSIQVGARARKIHQQLEAQVLAAADEIITITPFYQRRFEALSNRKVTLLMNGYDEDDFKNLLIQKTEKFVIRHVGIVNEKCDPRPFMRAVLAVAQQNELFRNKVVVDFVGDVHPAFREFVSSDADLAKLTLFTPTVPHKELIAKYGTSSVLLLVLTGYKDAEGYMPGKLYEYIATGLPVLGVGPEQGDAAKLLNETGAGKMIDGNHTDSINAFLLEAFQHWQQEKGIARKNEGNQYSRKEIAKKLAAMLY
jgi:glycosyltransferase involved in cell wall biosynthesis